MSGERILIVEDESILAMLIKGKLKSAGYEIADWVDRGEDAVKKSHELLPDLILMDIVLKGEMDGIEAAQQIRSSLDIPVIYLTAYSDDEVLKRAQVTEPYGYLIKPFREEELNANIEMAIYKYKSEMKKRDSIRKKVLSDFYEFIQTSLNEYSTYSDDEIRTKLLNIFSSRVEKDLKSNFDLQIDNFESDDVQLIFEKYLEWLSHLFSSFGIKNKIDSNDLGYYIEFINCPWEFEAKKKPIFCLNCQAVMNCSLNWAKFEGNVDRNATIADGSHSCIFRFY